MFCRYCGKLIDENARFCPHCSKEQFPTAAVPYEKTEPVPDIIPVPLEEPVPEKAEAFTGFMQAPSLDDSLPVTPKPVASVAEAVTPEPILEPTVNHLGTLMEEASKAESASVPLPAPSIPSTTPSVMEYQPPVGSAAEKYVTRKKQKQEKKSKKGIIFAVVFLAAMLFVGWLLSTHGDFYLSWADSERTVASAVSDKLDGKKLDVTAPETELMMGAPHIQKDGVEMRIYSISHKPSGAKELVCYFENGKLSGAEIYTDNPSALRAYIYNTFDISEDVVSDVVQLEYDNTYVVLLLEEDGARAIFADTTYGGLCSIALESYFGA